MQEQSFLVPRRLFFGVLCDFVILYLLQMKSFPSFLTSCEVGKTSGRSPARLGLIIISTNFDQIYRTLCHQTAASHWKKKIFNFTFALFLICFVTSIYPSSAFPLSWSILLLLYMFKALRGHKKILRHYYRWALIDLTSWPPFTKMSSNGFDAND